MSFQNFKFMCGVKSKGCIFASCAQFNSLVKINIENGDTQLLGKFPNEPINGEYLHKNAYIIGNDIYFIPYRATNICKYNMEKGLFDDVSIERDGYDGGYIAEQIGNKIYMIPEAAGGDILEVDTLTDNVSCVITKQQILAETAPMNQGMVFLRICAMGDSLLLPIRKTNRILEVEVKKKKMILHQINLDGLLGCFKGKDKVWFLSECIDKICYWDVFSNDIKHINFYPNYRGRKRYINWIVDMGEDVYIIPAWGTHIYRLIDNQFVKMEHFQADNINLQKFYTPIEGEGQICLLPLGVDNMILIQGDEIKQVGIKPMNSKTKLYREIMQAYMNNSSNRVIEEGLELDLEQYIDALIEID